MGIVFRLLTGLIGFIRPFFTNLFKKFGVQIFLGFEVFLGFIWGKIKVLFDRMPFYLAWLGAFYALFLGFISGADALIGSIVPMMPLSVVQGASWFLPNNLIECITLVTGSKMYRFMYDHGKMVLDARLQALK